MVIRMYEQWKVRQSFVDDVNIITKLFLRNYTIFSLLYLCIISILCFISLSLMLVFLLMFNGTQFKITAIFITISIGFALLSSLFMILYGNGSHTILKFGFIHITTESLVRGLHVSLRTIAISFFGILIALTSQVVMIFYSLMQHLKVKSKVAYAFMAAIRMIP
ncbi:CbiQ family ECF transporter T component [Staphylococcus aureus]